MPAPRQLVLLALGLALVTGTAACSDRASDEDEVRTTLQRFVDATAKKDFQTLCDDLFATQLVEEVERSVACELALKNSSLGDAQRPKLEITRVSVDGKKASADIRTSASNQPPSQDKVELIREGDEWRIISLSS